MQLICAFLVALAGSVRAAEFLREGTVAKGKDAPVVPAKAKGGKGTKEVPYSIVQVDVAAIPFLNFLSKAAIHLILLLYSEQFRKVE